MRLKSKEADLKRKKCSTRHIGMCTRRPQGYLIKARYMHEMSQLDHLVGEELGGGGEGGEQDPPQQLAVHGGGQPDGGQVV